MADHRWSIPAALLLIHCQASIGDKDKVAVQATAFNCPAYGWYCGSGLSAQANPNHLYYCSHNLGAAIDLGECGADVCLPQPPSSPDYCQGGSSNAKGIVAPGNGWWCGGSFPGSVAGHLYYFGDGKATDLGPCAYGCSSNPAGVPDACKPAPGGGTPDGGTPDGATTGGGSVSGEPMPVGDIPGWKQIFADDFTKPIPVGAFSDCNHNTDTPRAYCGGLAPYGNYKSLWWAYPNTWSDTAKSGADGNTGAPFGGVYHPEDTVSISDGAMHIRMFRPAAGGDNHVGTVVPIPCMQRQYGRYVERFKVVHYQPGFKSAHLFYSGGFEIDYPENDYGNTIFAFTHPGGAAFSSGAKWTSWHTTVIEWTSAAVKFYMDGRLIGSTSNSVPNIPMSWVLQNESSILGPYASPGASAQLDLDWVTCYAPN